MKCINNDNNLQREEEEEKTGMSNAKLVRIYQHKQHYNMYNILICIHMLDCETNSNL